MASLPISRVLERAMMSLRIWSLMVMTSMTAMRPAYPEFLQRSQPCPRKKLNPVKHSRVNAEVFKHFRRIGDRFLAVRTDAAHEALRAGQNHRGRNQKRCDAHVVEARDGAGRVVAVHRGQHLVAGERGRSEEH